MFSYRHAFHAGNHADVLKHSILIHIVEYFKLKQTPFWFIDTHAGTGIYNLSEAWASHSAESQTGLKKLQGTNNPPELIANYLETIAIFNHKNDLEIYPGSPALAFRLLRDQDKLFLFELLEAEYLKLGNLFYKELEADKKQVHIHMQDGFKGAIKLLPPQPRRGLIFIDPSYENKADYQSVINTLKIGLKKYAQGTYVLWHPLIQRVQQNEMLRALKKLDVKWLHVSLTVRKPASDGRGMHGSGMFVVNPPWTLYAALNDSLEWLRDSLAQDQHSVFTLEKFEP